MSFPKTLVDTLCPEATASPGIFLRDYWQKAPVFLPGALPGFSSPLSREDLISLSLQDEVEARLVSRTDPTVSSPFVMRRGPFSLKDFERVGNEKWTLLIQDLDKMDGRVAGLLGLIDFLPRWSVDDIMASFAVRGGSVGPHTDKYDVFLVQAQGTRVWQLSLEVDEDDLRTDTEMKVLARFEGQVTHVARPGDVLYLPPGVAHYGVAEDDCITLSFGFRAPPEAVFVSALCDEMVVLASDELVRERLSGPVVHPAEISSEVLGSIRDLVAQSWERAAQDVRFVGRVLTEAKPNVPSFSPGALSREEIEEHLQRGGRLGRAPSSRFLFLDESGSVVIFVDGQDYCLEDQPTARAFACLVTEAPSFSAEDLEACLGAQGLDAAFELLAEWGQAGALVRAAVAKGDGPSGQP